MEFSSAQLGAWIGSIMLPFFRIGAFVMALPIYTVQGVPRSVRMIFTAALTLAIVPLVPETPAIDPMSEGMLIMVAQQLLIGLTMGFILRLVFAAMVNAGQLIAMGMGLGFASMVDPVNGVQVPVVSMFYMIMAVLLYFAMDGHLVTIQVLRESFWILPIDGGMLKSSVFLEIAKWGTWMFGGAVLIALPAVATTMLTNVSFGVLARAAPQLNMFAVGFPIIIMVGFVTMWITLPYVIPDFTALTGQALEGMGAILRAR